MIARQALPFEPLYQYFFVMGFFEIGSSDYVLGAGFELRSS
jgi:hypothetical protein